MAKAKNCNLPAMGRLIVFILLLAATKVNAQTISGKVVDATTNKPLGYATVMYANGNKLLYTDSLGNFSLPQDSVEKKDSIYIQYIGYKKLAFPVARLSSANVFKMVQQSQDLETVVISNCRSFKEYSINKRVGSIKDYVGPGPETKFVTIGRYLANKDVSGYIKQMEIYTGNFNANTHVPVRIHWYAWDTLNNIPGKELTATSIIVYPYQQGWNSFILPANTIYFSGGIVIGLEFIYPVEYMQQYESQPSTGAKIAWLSNMDNRWSLGIQTTKDASQTGFYQVNNLPVIKYNSRGRNLFIKPALRFIVQKCLN